MEWQGGGRWRRRRPRRCCERRRWRFSDRPTDRARTSPGEADPGFAAPPSGTRALIPVRRQRVRSTFHTYAVYCGEPMMCAEARLAPAYVSVRVPSSKSSARLALDRGGIPLPPPRNDRNSLVTGCSFLPAGSALVAQPAGSSGRGVTLEKSSLLKVLFFVTQITVSSGNQQ